MDRECLTLCQSNQSPQQNDRLVPLERAEEWCRRASQAFAMGTSRPLAHFETSAKTAINVDDAFQEAARLALQYESYKQRATPQLFVPPAHGNHQPIDLRHQNSTMSTGSQDTCC